MTGPRLTCVLATGALAATLAGGIVPSSQAMPLPVTSVQEIAGTAPTEQVRWWGGYGWGWRRPYYGGGALAAGLIGGLALGTLAASTSYYGYGYPSYYGGYGYYPSAYYAPAYYGYHPYRRAYYRPVYYRRAYVRPVYYRRAYYRPVYYRRAYWR